MCQCIHDVCKGLGKCMHLYNLRTYANVMLTYHIHTYGPYNIHIESNNMNRVIGTKSWNASFRSTAKPQFIGSFTNKTTSGIYFRCTCERYLQTVNWQSGRNLPLLTKPFKNQPANSHWNVYDRSRFLLQMQSLSWWILCCSLMLVTRGRKRRCTFIHLEMCLNYMKDHQTSMPSKPWENWSIFWGGQTVSFPKNWTQLLRWLVIWNGISIKSLAAKKTPKTHNLAPWEHKKVGTLVRN